MISHSEAMFYFVFIQLVCFYFNVCYSKLFSFLVSYLDLREPEGRISFMHLL